jgi:TonB-linked SusC/RagA family outer membrane protein
MKKLLYKPLIRIAGYSCMGILVQLLFVSLSFAHDADPQQVKSIHDVAIETVYKNASLADVFADIESKTDFVFTFDKKDTFLKERFSKPAGTTTVANLLKDISRTSKLVFQQINNNISVRKQKINEKVGAPTVIINTAIKISGTVTSSSDGRGIPGVSILIKGSSTGTVTDVDGSFSLNAPNEDDILVFSSIGYATQEIAIEGRSNINVNLIEDMKNLDEIVVVGYTSKQITELSSSVSVVSSEELQDVTSNNVNNLLQGKAPGIVVSSASGNPNSAPSVVIRGSSSISAGSEPLYVVDGIIGGNANPNDIESVTVLKDAAATGLYGSRAANGVIIVTTKSGKSGETKINFSSTTGFNKATTGNFKVMDSQQLYDYHESFFDPADFSSSRPASLLSTDINWQELAFRTGITQNHLLSISGGSEKTQFYLGGNYYKEEGTIRHNSNEAYNIRANISHMINDKLKVNVKFNTNFRKLEEEPSGTNALYGAYNNIPWDDPYNSDGSLKIGTEDGWIGREKESFLHGWQYNFNGGRQAGVDGDINLEYYLSKNLTFSSYNRASYTNSRRETYYDVQSKAGAGDGMLYNRFSYGSALITSNRLRYENNFGAHNIGALAVAEAEKNYYEANNMLGRGLVSGMHVLDAASEIRRVNPSGQKTENAFSKGLMQVDYNYGNRYFVVGSFIRESSSRFGANNRSANFYTLGTSWILSNEGFMRNQKIFDLLKIRASYGSIGNAQIGNYQALGLYSFSLQYAGLSASVPNQLANNDLTWEKAKTVNFGLDISLLQRISLNIDLYDKTTDGLLLDVDIPYTSGYSSVTQNIGSIRNRGLELNLNTQNLKGGLKWETNFNIAFNRNKVLALNNDTDIVYGHQIISVGSDLYSWYLRKWAGVDPQNGDPLWEVISESNGETFVNTTNSYSDASLQFVGTASPDFTGGINNTFTYKRFSLSAFLNFVSGSQVFHLARELYDSDGSYQTYNNMILVDGWNRWEQPGDIATHPKPVFAGNQLSNKPSSRYLENGSYIRLRNVTFSYNLTPSFLSRIRVSKARLFVSGDNLWTGTNFTGMDPEVGLGSGGGISRIKYPISRKLLFGINIEL